MDVSGNDGPQVRPWHKGVRGTQVLPIIDLDDPIIRVEAGPGTGKTFGLVRRVQRILHPEGLNVPGKSVLIVAFNRVIAKQLRDEISELLNSSPHDGDPIIETVHALCLKVIGNELRILLPHEREAMIYDVLDEHEVIRKKYGNYAKTEQALKDHEAQDKNEVQLWQAVERWRTRHSAQLISELPTFLLDRIQGGDFTDKAYNHVIVDEFQDLTPAEQRLFVKLKAKLGNFMALGDPRQSIYRFRGNEKDGLSKLNELLAPDNAILSDVTMTECQRCPKEIVEAANRLMGLYESVPMIPGNENLVNWHLVGWKSLEAEAKGMAENILSNIRANPAEKSRITHLAMVTRRQFGYRLRDELLALDNNIKIDLSFSEGLLETWAVREAFLYFCLLVDPDAPTWRAWFSYQDPVDDETFKAPKRNANAYLKFLTFCNDIIDEEKVRNLAVNLTKPAGTGGGNLWERAKRFVSLREQLQWRGDDSLSLLQEVFDVNRWTGVQAGKADTEKNDMGLIFGKAADICRELEDKKADSPTSEKLEEVARRLRYQIATREPFLPEEASDLQITTLWGAKGITADHVYILGLCKEAIPGTRREEYPGTDLDYVEEQKRLFYVSITRAKKTLVLSRATSIAKGQAKQLGLKIKNSKGYRADLEMSPFLRDIKEFLPAYQIGDDWAGCI